MTRSKCLDAAKACVLGDREETHGKPADVFGMVAAMWSAYLGVKIAPCDVAMMMCLLKAARFAHNPKWIDHAVDICGYSAIAAELAP